jgi:hypothetical protein
VHTRRDRYGLPAQNVGQPFARLSGHDPHLLFPA